MKLRYAVATASLALAIALPAAAQTTTKVETKTKAGTTDGVPSVTTKQVHVTKRKTRHAKRILGVKVGQKTKVDKTVKETTTTAAGDQSTTVKTTHK